MKQAETMLLSGFVCAALGAGLSQFVMIGLIGIALGGMALGVLFCAGSIANSTAILPWWQKLAGLLLYLAGVLGSLLIASYASNLAFNHTQGGRPGMEIPQMSEWIMAALLSVPVALLVSLGLRIRSQWSWSHCLIWGLAALCVQPLALGIFWILAPILPLTA